jgi:hypothetical protein
MAGMTGHCPAVITYKGMIQMYTNELKNIVTQIHQSVHPKQIKRTSLTIKPYWNRILNATNFLPNNANCSERLYCIEHNITSIVMCKACNKQPVKYWNGAYLTYCCNQCARPDAINKMKQTCVQKYGTPWVSQTPRFRNRVKSTIKSKYGVDNLFKDKEFVRKSVFNKLGVQNPMHNTNIKNKCIATRIKRHGDVYLPNIGNNEKRLLDQRESIDKCSIARDFKIGMYNPDGYCKKTNTIYEVYEKYHTYTKQKEKDKIRQSYIQEELKCNFVIIWDLKNKEKIIEHHLYT